MPAIKGRKIRLEVQGNGRMDVNLLGSPAANQLLVNAETDLTTREIFVYGEEVTDFRTVDYDALSTLNISATQELARRLKASDELVQKLKVENEKLKANQTEQQKINETMKAQIDAINERLNTTGSK